jgi:hypothetical protein
MDGGGAWRDNVFVERLWRSVKYEYLRAYEDVSDARVSIGRYLDFYNSRRPHSGLDGITPDHTTSRQCLDACRPTPAEAPFIEAGNLFRQPAPALYSGIAIGLARSKSCLEAYCKVEAINLNMVSRGGECCMKLRGIWAPTR